jgi:hypothetical protein
MDIHLNAAAKAGGKEIRFIAALKALRHPRYARLRTMNLFSLE